jgi:hypothetical protein
MTLKQLMYAGAALIFLFPCLTLANDIKLGPNHKMGVVIHTTDKYSLILTTKHGKPEQEFKTYESLTMDAAILVGKPVPASQVYYGELSSKQKYFHWGNRGYIVNDFKLIVDTTFETTHSAWPGHSGSGVYDEQGRLVGICIQYHPFRHGDKTGRCIALRTTYLKNFINNVKAQVEKEYK